MALEAMEREVVERLLLVFVSDSVHAGTRASGSQDRHMCSFTFCSWTACCV